MSVAETLVGLVQIWGLCGSLVAVAFLTVGLGRIDEDAKGAIAFRPLLVPGVLVLWPLVLWRWWILSTGRDKWPLRHAPPRRSHAVVAAIMAVVIGITLLVGFSIRQTVPTDFAPVQLAP